MKSTTIYKARIKAGHRYVNLYPGPCGRQLATFHDETLRRLDERDTMRADIDRLQRDLAEALASESHAAKLHSNVSTELLRMDAQLAEARAEVERLRPAAEKWIADEEARNRARAARGKG